VCAYFLAETFRRSLSAEEAPRVTTKREYDRHGAGGVVSPG